MSEAEQQLRDFIRLHDRGMEANLDAVVNEALGLDSECLKQAEENRAALEARAVRAERSLSALRELAESAAEGDTGALELLVEEARKTAHDAAPAALTLTLEEVQNQAYEDIARIAMDWSTGTDNEEARELLEELSAAISGLAQKGAGRGDGK